MKMLKRTEVSKILTPIAVSDHGVFKGKFLYLLLRLIILSFSVVDLHLNCPDQLVRSAIAQLQQDLTEGLWLFTRLGISLLNMERFIELIDGYISKLD